MLTFSPEMFPSDAVFTPAGSTAERRGAVDLNAPGAGVSMPCYVEPGSTWALRDENDRIPEGRKPWNVFTPTDPAAGVDSGVIAEGMTLTVTARSVRHDTHLWRTECVQVD